MEVNEKEKRNEMKGTIKKNNNYRENKRERYILFSSSPSKYLSRADLSIHFK